MDALAPGAMTTPPREPAGAVGGAWPAWAREHEHRQIRIIRLAGRAREAGTRSAAAAADTRHWAGRGAATCAASLAINARDGILCGYSGGYIHTTRRESQDAAGLSGVWTTDGRRRA